MSMVNLKQFRSLAALICGSVSIVNCSGAPQTPASTGIAAAVPTATTPGDAIGIQFHNNPDPPHSGDNHALVAVTGADGVPVSDATVTTVYYMPAMPSMGMPEMRNSFPMTSDGNGSYSGSGNLVMAGTWNVTVTVSRSDKVLGSQKFTVIAK